MSTTSLVSRRKFPVALVGLAGATLLVAACSDGKTASTPASKPVPQRSTALSSSSWPPGSRSLVVRASGWGRGTVTVTPDPGMTCEDYDESQDFMQICTGSVAPTIATVVVGVAAMPGAVFTGWSGGPCSGSTAPSCTIPMSQDQLIDVVFQLGSVAPSAPTPSPDSVLLTIDMLGRGTGSISGTPDIGLVCARSARSNISGTCSAQIPTASLPRAVTLQASADGGSTFSGWGASCSASTGDTCSLTVAGRVAVTAGFVPAAPGTPPTPLPAPASLTITPATLVLDACRGYVFVASAPPGTDSRVTWSVQEVGGGTVVNGIYSAPAAPGTYHLVASSLVSPSVQAVAAVTVTPEKVLSVAVTPGSIQVQPGGGARLAATVTTSCGTYPAN
jgi:hypothetical protein